MAQRTARGIGHTILMITVLTAGNLVSAQTEPLRGTVVNKSDHGVKDVKITVLEPGVEDPIEETTSDEDGAFSLPMESLRPGYEIRLNKDAYHEVVLPVTPQQLVVASIRVVMEPSRSISSARPTPRPTPTPPPTLANDRQRKKAVALYNDGVELWEKEKKNPIKQKEALQMIREAASMDPDFREPLVLLNRNAMKNQMWSEASRYSEALLRIDPNDSEAARTQYFCMVITQHFLGIGDAARRLIALEPDTIVTIHEHADAFYTNENYTMARPLYEVLAELSQDPTAAYINLGACCIQLGDPEGTRTAFEAFLEVAPADHPHRETVESDLAAMDAGTPLE